MSKVMYIDLGSGYESENGCEAYRNFLLWMKTNPHTKIVENADFRKDYKHAYYKFVFMYHPYYKNQKRMQKHIYAKAIIEYNR